MRMKFWLFMFLTGWLLLAPKALSAAENRFYVYNASNGLSDNSAQTIKCTLTGRLIITTSGQINFFDGQKFNFIDPDIDDFFPIPNYKGHYHLYFDKSDRKSPPSPAKTVQKKEKRIPVDPMSGEVVKCYVEVVPDPGAPPVSTGGGYYPGVRGSLKGVHAPAFYTKTPFLIGNCARKEGWDPWDPSIPPTDSPDGPAADIPDGMEYRLKVLPHNMGTLSKGFLCGFADRRKSESPRYYVLMLPYDQCEDGRYVMLSQKDTTMPWPFLDEPLLDRDRRAVTELKNGANVFLKSLWTPVILVLDVAWLIVLFPVWCVINLIKLFLLSIAFITRFG